MHFASDTISDGVRERSFFHNDIPGALWSPADSRSVPDTASPPALVLLGHGGGQHKTAPGVAARARRLVTGCGFTAAAIDAPGHGDRPRTDRDEQFVAAMRERREAGEPFGPLIAGYNAAVAAQAVPDWQSVLDAILDQGDLASGARVGYWGVSMGTAIGVPLAAAEPRISAAVFGLAGHDALADAAARVSIPVEFLLQWDDELIPRESGLALFDAFASPEKTLHANPGGHLTLPMFEIDSALRFFARHLG